MKQQFTQEEANAILMRAVEHQPLRETVTWEQLVALAAEIGVSEDALQQAQAGLQVQHRTEDVERARFQRYQRDVFKARVKCVLHFAAFLLGTLTLIGINSEVSDDFPWCLGIIIPWAMILAAHWKYVRYSVGDEHDEAFLRWMRARRSLGAEKDPWANDPWTNTQGPNAVR